MRNVVVCLTIALIAAAMGVPTAHAARCSACDVALEQCLVGCSGLDAKASQRVACLLGCDNAAARCSCDGAVSLRNEDVVDDRAIRAAAAAACHSTTPCDSSYGACTGWSAYFDCGDAICGINRYCGDPCDPCLNSPDPGYVCPCFGPALKQSQERYRVCFNAQGQSCTEYQRITQVLTCGC